MSPSLADTRPLPAQRPAPLVALRGAALTYPGPPPVAALKPTDLTIEESEHVAVVGASGSGKSTLLNLLGLLDRPTAGRYELGGHDTAALPEADRTAVRARWIGFVFQAFHLMPYRTARENVALALLYAATLRRERDRRAAQVLQRVGLGHRIDALPTTLSGGEAQRVAIARALLAGPRLLLCDEPTGNLDSATATTVLELLDDLHRDGMTIVVITHDLNVAARAGRVVTIHDGYVSSGIAGPVIR